ncbi:ATP-binding protein [Pseudomonas sp. GD03746]|uniref:ATP-binding protein n=1 Tax=Pseudomonas sp. GD03746 TaxID=2975378 RepID=UPI00244B4B86|nr:ATP-binding protein [Pseudomonas sp. GD03746]MDH1576538.1 ATP-binding protein [Pseudomonas sp. GD03746]
MNQNPFENLYGLEGKLDQIYTYCKAFLDIENDRIEKFSLLSIYPTFLLDGYPGTGKSSAATAIYQRLKKDHNIDLKRLNIDELISHNFGESSSNLREYFNAIQREIEDNNSHCFLVMDEVDSFTISRHQNDNESIKRILLTFNTIIDELVRTKDIYKYIVFATTNIKESIDTSILRRFYFKEDFNIVLDNKQFKRAFLQMCEIADIKIDDTATNQIYKSYLEKKYTLGEIKSIISRAYMRNITSSTEGNLDIKEFQEAQTFHEITLKQRQK